MSPILTLIALGIITVSGQTQGHNLLETLYKKAVSPTTDQHNDNLRNVQSLASVEGTSNKPCPEIIQSKKDASESLPLDDPNVKHQLIYTAAPKLRPTISAPSCRRAIVMPNVTNITTIEHLNELYHGTGLDDLGDVVVPPMEKDIPFYNLVLLDESGNYPEAGEYDYVSTTTEEPPTTILHIPDDFLISWRRKNDEATLSPLDKDEMQKEISSESQTNFVPSVNAEITRAQSNIDCGDEKQTENTKSSDKIVLYGSNHFETTDNSLINLNTDTKKGEEFAESRSDIKQARKLKKNGRVCYACSTASNPNCLVPNNRTTIKYCQGDRDSCVTKTFVVYDTKDPTVLTRDCGSSCSENSIPGVSPPYTKCSVCNEDLCNGAFSLNKQNLIFICSMLFYTVIKSWV